MLLPPLDQLPHRGTECVDSRAWVEIDYEVSLDSLCLVGCHPIPSALPLRYVDVESI